MWVVFISIYFFPDFFKWNNMIRFYYNIPHGDPFRGELKHDAKKKWVRRN